MTNCQCMVNMETGGGCELHRAVRHVARKTHKCGECDRLITPGEVYERVDGRWHGQFHHTKTCPDCLSVRDALFCRGWNYNLIWLDLESHIYVVNGQVSEDCLRKLTPRARARVCQLIEDVWDFRQPKDVASK